ncbi:MAG: YlxR family protein [Actinomycetota bacterium]
MNGPVRTCIGCRTRRPAAELRRLAVVEGTVRFGRTLPGRGAWLCPDQDCWELAVKRRAFERAFRGSVALDDPPADTSS